jgi:hypothetical protein
MQNAGANCEQRKPFPYLDRGFRSHRPLSSAPYVEGITHQDSDIDIAAFSPAVGSMRYDEKINLIVEIERQMDASVELHLFGAKPRRSSPH